MSELVKDTFPEPDLELVDAMQSRVVRRKPQPYGNRKAGPGRPKGSIKTGGRKAGTPNLMSPEFRQWLAEKAKPFELLAAICAGEEIQDGGKKREPTLSERMRAAETIARKLVPDLATTALTGVEGRPVAFSAHDNAPAMSDFEFARRVSFLLAAGIHDAGQAVERPAKALQATAPSLPRQAPPTPAE